MDTGKAFSYVFEDPSWVKKVAIYAVILIFSILIVPIFILIGYSLQTMRNVRAGLAQPLPEWNDIGGLLVDGLKMFVVGLVYMAPYILLSILGSIFQGNRNLAVIGALFNCLGFIYYLAALVAMPAVVGAYLRNNDIGGAFNFGAVIRQVQGNLGDFIMVWLLGIVAQLIGAAGAIACGIGLLFTLPYSSMIVANLWGQLLRKLDGSSSTGGEVPMIGTTPL
jgi:hypothetical protein